MSIIADTFFKVLLGINQFRQIYRQSRWILFFFFLTFKLEGYFLPKFAISNYYAIKRRVIAKGRSLGTLPISQSFDFVIHFWQVRFHSISIVLDSLWWNQIYKPEWDFFEELEESEWRRSGKISGGESIRLHPSNMKFIRKFWRKMFRTLIIEQVESRFVEGVEGSE